MGRAKFNVLIIPHRSSNDVAEFAVTKRSDGNIWQFLSGGGEDDETPMQAAKREAYEEGRIPFEIELLALDSKASIPAHCFAAHKEWGDDVYVVPEYSFGAEIGGEGLVLSNEHTHLLWLNYHDARERLTFDSNRVALWELYMRISNGHDAAVQRIHSLIDSLDREGSTPIVSRNPDANFRRVSIPTAEGKAIQKWVIGENATQTIEIGLAFGFSALHICEGLLVNGNSDPRHVIMDPYQSPSTGYAECGLELLEQAGVKSFVEFHGEKSQLVLPQLQKEGRLFDLAFIDGNHRFDAVFLDLYYLGHLVRKGGIIILDDYSMPGIERAASFFVTNLGWKIEETAQEGEHRWIVLRTSIDEDTRDFRYFKDF